MSAGCARPVCPCFGSRDRQGQSTTPGRWPSGSKVEFNIDRSVAVVSVHDRPDPLFDLIGNDRYVGSNG